MATVTCRILPYSVADGPHNMAADEVMLQTASRGSACLRFYGSSEATVSLGYFQSHQCLQQESSLAALPWVRRITGGKTLVHHHELTYALALPPGPPWQGRYSWLERMHGIITAAITQIGVDNLSLHHGDPHILGQVLCFQQHTSGDGLCHGNKVIGSAQRKQRKSLLQHGAILLSRSPYTPALSGLRDITGLSLPMDEIRKCIQSELERHTRWQVEAHSWTNQEVQTIEEIGRAHV